MELWRHAKRIVEAPVDIAYVLWILITTGKWDEDGNTDVLRYFGIFIIMTSVLITMMQ